MGRERAKGKFLDSFKVFQVLHELTEQKVSYHQRAGLNHSSGIHPHHVITSNQDPPLILGITFQQEILRGGTSKSYHSTPGPSKPMYFSHFKIQYQLHNSSPKL